MTTGRRRDEFAWRHVNRSIDGSRWECIFCRTSFAGSSASRIRLHLSGEGRDIASCPSVPMEIRQEALNRNTLMSNPNNNNTIVVTAPSFSGDINLVGERDMMSNYVLPRGDLVDTNHSVPSLSEIFSGGGESDVASSDLNELMSEFGRLITPSVVAQGVSGMEIDSVVVNMAHLGLPSSSAAAPLQVDMAPEHVTDAFMKLLMISNCSSSAVTDFMKSPLLREFLERASEYGVPSGLLAGDSEVVRKSMFNITEEVYRHTLMLKESWKTTGCTLMVFKGIFPSDQNMCMFGFYCPKGIVFVEAPDPDLDFTDFRSALKRHKPSLDFDPATNYAILRHNSNYSQGSDDWTTNLASYGWKIVESHRCLRDEVEEICIDICRESAWAESLVNKAVEIHEKICCHGFLRQGYYQILQKDVECFNDLDNIKGLPAFRLSVFLSLMRPDQNLKHELSEYIKRKSLGEDVAESLEAIFHNRCKLWDDGWKLRLVLTNTLEFSECMDTLVPTSGYLATAIEQLEDRLRLDSRYPVMIEGEDSFTFWKELKSRLTGIIQGSTSMEAASYMNPHYFLQEDVQRDPQLPKKVFKALDKAWFREEYDGADEDQNFYTGELFQQVQRYGDVFSRKLSANNTLRDYHPAKLWEEHGHELPYLQKHAIVLLSKPLNCMCKQLKKHMYQLQGAEDYILRLNVKMMQEFKLLGDDMYKPPDFSLSKGWFM